MKRKVDARRERNADGYVRVAAWGADNGPPSTTGRGPNLFLVLIILARCFGLTPKTSPSVRKMLLF